MSEVMVTSLTVEAKVPIPTAADLAPAAIAVRNVAAVASDLVLKRDIYYTQSPGRIDYGVVWEDRYPRTPTDLFDFLSDPSRFPSLANLSEPHRVRDRARALFHARRQQSAEQGQSGLGNGGFRVGFLRSQALGSSAAAFDGKGILCLLAARHAVWTGHFDHARHSVSLSPVR